MGKKKMKRLMKGLPIVLLIAMMIGMCMGATAYAQTAYWTDSSDTRIPGEQENLAGTATQTIRLKADVPAGSTLQAYKFTVNYDAAVVEVVNVVKKGFTLFANDDVPGIIAVNGFDVNGLAGSATVDIMDVTVKGLKNGSSEFGIVVNTFGAGSDKPIALSTVPVTVNVTGITVGPHKSFFADETNVRFPADQTALSVGETKVLHLIAEIPNEKLLKAFHFTLTYDAAKIGVLKIERSADSRFETTINEPTPGTISVNGFWASGELGEFTAPLLDITIKGVAESSSVFGITANNFGNDTEEFIPEVFPLNITVNPVTSFGNKAFWSDDAAGVRFTADQTDMTVGDTKVIRLTAEIPAGETLRAFKFTLPYSPAGIIDVLKAEASAASAFRTTINETANSIVVNGFYANGFTGTKIDLLDVTVKAVAKGTAIFGIAANNFGDNVGNEFIPDTFPLTINVEEIPSLENKVFWTDSTNNLRFTDDKLDIAVDDNQVIRLAAEIPANKTLRAYKFTLTYDPAVIEVIDIGKLAFGNTFINDTLAGKIVFNGFDTTGTEGGANGFILPLLDVNIKGLAAGTTNFGIQADNFGDIDSPTDEFKPTPYPLAITVTGESVVGKAYFANTSNVKLDPYALTLDVNAQQIIRLMAEVPAGKTLKAYRFTLAYDNTVVEITGVNDAVSPFKTNGNVITNNDTANSEIITNGFDVTGVGEGDYAFLELSVKGLKAGTTTLTITVDSFGTDSANQFAPVPENLPISVAGVIPTKHIINATAGANGTITPSGSVEVVHGGNQLFTFTPNAGYEVEDVLVDGISQGVRYSYTFNNVTTDHNISVTFKLSPVTYTIAASAGPNGAIVPQGVITVNAGATQDFIFYPNAGYKVADVVIDGVSIGAAADNKYTFANVNANRTIYVTFEPIDVDEYYTITPVAGMGGTITPSYPVQVEKGANSPVFVLTPNPGYVVNDVQIDNISVGSLDDFTFENVTADHTIYVAFRPAMAVDYTITATAGANGTISPSGAVKVSEGANQSFIIKAGTGYEVEDVVVDGKSVDIRTGYTFMAVNSNHTINVTFKKIPVNIYTIMATAGANGAISPAGAVSVSEGANQTFNFTPNTGYVVENVVVDGSSVGAKYTHTFTNVAADHTIHVSFKKGVPTYTITATAGANGSINPDGKVTVNEGASQTFTFTPNADYVVANVEVDGISVGAKSSHTFTSVTANHTIHVTFKESGLYTITATAGANGSISPAGKVTVKEGSNQKFVFTPNAGYVVADVTIDGVSVGALNEFTFENVAADRIINVTFIESGIVYHTITATAGTNGSISPSGAVKVKKGVNQTFTFAPNAEYAVDVVTVDGISVNSSYTYTFSNVTSDHTINVTFKLIVINQYTITVTVNDSSMGTVYPSGTIQVAEGGSQAFTITPNDGYEVEDVVVNGVSKGPLTTYTLTGITANSSIYVTFKKTIPVVVNYTITASAGVGGTISPPGPVVVESGTNETFTIEPDTASGYVVDTVTVDSVPAALTDGQYYIFSNVTANHTIHATFKVVKYTITASAGVGGVIEPAGPIEVIFGGSKTFYMEADEDYEIADVKVDGASLGIRTSYTFPNVNADHSIRVTFTEVVTPVTEIRPNPPKLVKPCDNTETSLTPVLETTGFSYPAGTADEDKSGHAWTGFRISTDPTFKDPTQSVFKGRKTDTGLTFFTVPEFTLREGETYYWKASYANDLGVASEWSDVCSFTTKRIKSYTESNGAVIPADKKVLSPEQYYPAGTDLIGYSLVTVEGGSTPIAVKAGAGAKLTYLDSVDAGKIAIPSGVSMPMGLATFTLQVENCNSGEPGKVVESTVLLAKPLPLVEDNPKWYQYDRETARMLDYSDHAKFHTVVIEGKSYYDYVTLEFQDGGFGDLDGIVNCQVSVGPSGYGVPTVGRARGFTVTTYTNNLKANFDASTSTGECFVWDFGDGTPNDISCLSTSADGIHKVVTHEYKEKGTYTVTLLAMGATGSESISQKVTVPKPAEGDGGGDNCFISTTANGSMSFGSMLALMLMTVVGAITVFFFRKEQR